MSEPADGPTLRGAHPADLRDDRKEVLFYCMNAILRKRLIAVSNYGIAGAVLGAGFTLLATVPQDAALLPFVVAGGATGLMIGVGLGLGEEFLVPVSSRRFGFYMTNAGRTVLYGLYIGLMLLAGNAAGHVLSREAEFLEGLRRYVTDSNFGRDLVLALLASVLFTGYVQIRRLHNPGEIWKLLLGRYQYPREESRVFLFADLIGSTAVAERLGHVQYSSYLRDVFMDVSQAVLAYKGDVYQHFGDGLIVSWKWSHGIEKAVCVACFFDMRSSLLAREAWYEERYGVVPRLRGGIHGGEVATTWVGEAKKEIAFHGDVVNTTSRIQWMCRDLDAKCLVSKPVYQALQLGDRFTAESQGEITIRGKRESVALFALDVLA